MKEDKDLFDLDFAGLDHYEPSMRFAKNVVEKVKAETELLKPERGPLYWIPRLCMASFGLIFMVFLGILVTQKVELSFVDIAARNGQMLIAVIGAGLAVPSYLLLDRLLKKLVLS